MANIFEQKGGDEIIREPNGQTMVAMDTKEVLGGRPLPGERSNPAMAVRNITRPRFGYDY